MSPAEDFAFYASPKGIAVGRYRCSAVDQFCAPQDFRLDRMLLQPFRDDPGPYAINRRWKAG